MSHSDEVMVTLFVTLFNGLVLIVNTYLTHLARCNCDNEDNDRSYHEMPVHD